MERYSEYKDSGVKWLGEIPSHWEVKRLGSFFYERKEKVSDQVFAPLSVTKQGIFPQLDNVAKTNDRKGSSGVSELDGSVSLINIVLQPRKTIFGPFCNYLLKSYGFIEENYRNGRGIVADLWTTRYDEMKMIKVALPSLEEQKTISSYLDSATSEIDKAIAMQQKMIDLLNERKQIIIQNAVTKGLDENVEMKESGVEWIGRIPKHWEVSKLKYIIKEPLKYGANEASEYIDYSCPRYIRITDIDSNGKLKEDTFRSLPRDKAEPYLLSKGDILFARSGATVGKAFLFEEEYKACYAGYLIKASFDNKKVLSKFVYLYTQTLAYQRWKESIFIQATIQNISGEKYSNMQIAIPPISEQKKLIDWLLPRLNGFDSAITNCQRQITLLQERKQIIINEVVTGKVRVS